MKYVGPNTNVEFRAIMKRRCGQPKGVELRRILKSGKPGKPMFYKFYSAKKTAQEVIDRLESNNPGDCWVEA